MLTDFEREMVIFSRQQGGDATPDAILAALNWAESAKAAGPESVHGVLLELVLDGTVVLVDANGKLGVARV